jgi:integrase
MGSRRGHGEGSIYQRASDGLWVSSIDLGIVDGKRKPIYGKTRKEVADKLKAVLHEQQQGILPIKAQRQTVGQYLTTWLEDSVKPTVRPRTYASYKQLCNLYILPSLGRVQLSQLTPQQVQRFENDLASKNVKRTGTLMSTRTVGYCHVVLRRGLNQAVKYRLIGRNPVLMIGAPKRTRPEAKFLTPDEARAFLAFVRGERLEALYMLAITTGMRQGELLGVTWSNINLDSGILEVRQAVQRVEGKLTFVEPKSKSSKRTIALSGSAITALRTHRKRQLEERLLAGSTWQGQNLVFPNTIDAIYDAGNMVREFHKALKRAGLPKTNSIDCGTLAPLCSCHKAST